MIKAAVSLPKAGARGMKIVDEFRDKYAWPMVRAGACR